MWGSGVAGQQTTGKRHPLPCAGHYFRYFIKDFLVQTIFRLISINQYQSKSMAESAVDDSRWIRLFLSTPTVYLHGTTARSNVIGQYYSTNRKTSASQMPKSCPGGLQNRQFCVYIDKGRPGKLLRKINVLLIGNVQALSDSKLPHSSFPASDVLLGCALEFRSTSWLF